MCQPIADIKHTPGKRHMDASKITFLKGPRRAERTAAREFLAFARPVAGAIRAQFNSSRRNAYDLAPVFLQPAYTLVLTAVFKHAGRDDLSTYAWTAPMLMGVAATAAYQASDLMGREKDGLAWLR